MNIQTKTIPTTNCPNCYFTIGTIFEGETGHKPRPGDTGLCANCQTRLTVCEGWSLRLSTKEEIMIAEGQGANEHCQRLREEIERRRLPPNEETEP